MQKMLKQLHILVSMVHAAVKRILPINNTNPLITDIMTELNRFLEIRLAHAEDALQKLLPCIASKDNIREGTENQEGTKKPQLTNVDESKSVNIAHDTFDTSQCTISTSEGIHQQFVLIVRPPEELKKELKEFHNGNEKRSKCLHK
jgi:hypothetical protein